MHILAQTTNHVDDCTAENWLVGYSGDLSHFHGIADATAPFDGDGPGSRRRVMLFVPAGCSTSRQQGRHHITEKVSTYHCDYLIQSQHMISTAQRT